MNAAKPSRFKIGSDTERPDKIYQEEIQDLRVEKLSHRVTLLTILIPCLIGVVIVITYLDIKDRVASSLTTGNQGMQALSQDVASKFSQLSLKEAKLGELIDQKLSVLEKNTAVIQARLRTAQKAIAKMQSDMALKSEVDEAFADIRRVLTPLPPQLQELAASAKAADDKLALEIAAAARDMEDVKESLLKIETDLIGLRAGKVDYEALDTRLQEERQALQKEWRQSLKKLEKSIKALEQNQKAAVKPTAQTRSSATPASPPPVKQQVSQPTAPTAPKPAPQSTAPSPPPGKIVEQDIQ